MEIKSVNFTSKIENFEVVNEEFIRCKCYMLATGDNANGSDITLSAVQKAIDKGEFYNKPIVAHLYRDENDNGKYRVGGHDSKWVISSTGIEEINECIPFGVIPESSHLQLETVLEADGITHNTYLVGEIILWVGRYNIMDAAYSGDVYFNQSCELLINDSYFKENGNLAITDFTFSALCLLNKSDDKEKNVRPCFPSCRVERLHNTFSLNNDENFNNQFELLMERTKSISVNNTINNEPVKEEKTMDFEKIKSVLDKKYSVISYTENDVTVFNKEDYCVYTISFTVENDEVTFDYENQIEKSVTACDKTDESYTLKADITDVVQAVSETKVADAIATAQENFEVEKLNALNELTEKFNALSAEYENLKTENTQANQKLAEYAEAERVAREEAHKAEINSVIESYASKLGTNAEYLMYKTKVDFSKTKEQVDTDMLLILGKAGRDNKTSFSYAPTAWGASDVGANDNATSRYGTLFDKVHKD